MTLLPFTEEAEWLRFVPCWLHANLKMAARQWNKRQHNRKYLANSATQEISCEFGYLSATCRSARARFLSPIDGANHNARIVPRLRCPIGDRCNQRGSAPNNLGARVRPPRNRRRARSRLRPFQAKDRRHRRRRSYPQRRPSVPRSCRRSLSDSLSRCHCPGGFSWLDREFGKRILAACGSLSSRGRRQFRSLRNVSRGCDTSRSVRRRRCSQRASKSHHHGGE